MKLLLTIFSCLFVLSNYAQKNFLPGILITNHSDTIRGFINYPEKEKTPKSVLFKNAQDAANAKSFGVEELSFFEISGKEKYVRCNCMISNAPNQFPNLNSSRDTTSKMETIWLREVASGQNLVLYEFTDALKKRFFIKPAAGGSPEELQYYAYIIGGDNPVIMEEHKFRQQLYAFADKYADQNKNLAAMIATAGYRVDNITRITGIINNKDEKSADANGLRNWQYYVSGGFTRSVFQIVGEEFVPYRSFTFNNSIAPFVSGGIDFLANPKIGKARFRQELGLTFRRHDGADESGVYKGLYHLSQTMLLLSSSYLQSIYRKPAFQVFAGIGVTGVLLINNRNVVVKPGEANESFDFYELAYAATGHLGMKLSNQWEISGSASLPVMQALNYAHFQDKSRWQHLKLAYVFSDARR